MTGPDARWIDSDIADVCRRLRENPPAEQRARLEAELQDLRLARIGIRRPKIEGRSRVLRRGPKEWGQATRAHLS